MLSLHLANHQHHEAVPVTWLRRVGRCAVRHLKIAKPGCIAVSFINGPSMRRLHGRFLGTTEPTDVLSFRYDDTAGAHQKRARSRIVGEILIAPSAARWYAARHRLSYRQELARYLVHGLLHWLGHDDRTRSQRRTMRALEDRLLAECA